MSGQMILAGIFLLAFATFAFGWWLRDVEQQSIDAGRGLHSDPDNLESRARRVQ